MWDTSRSAGGTWAIPAALGVGQLRKGPYATGERDGQVGVFWGGASRSLWSATYTGQAGWSPAAQTGAGMSGEPAVVASPAGTESAFWKGRGARLWRTTSAGGGGGWNPAAPLPLGKIGGGVFVAGQKNGVVDVFWRGPADHHL
jgi:hypothetical protein